MRFIDSHVIMKLVQKLIVRGVEWFNKILYSKNINYGSVLGVRKIKAYLQHTLNYF